MAVSGYAATAMPRALLALAAVIVPAALAFGVSSGRTDAGTVSVLCKGVERWDIKTLSDVNADQVKLDPSAIKHVSVKTLRLKKKPADAAPGRIPPVETTVYEVKAALIKARWVWDPRPGTLDKKRGDRDIHLVIAAPSDKALTMIVEFPDPACVDAKDELKKMMRDARNAFISCQGLMPPSNKPFKTLSGTATINGPGFFDRPHAIGHAPFGVEIHPVLFFSSSDCP
jgi:hypothetical protein